MNKKILPTICVVLSILLSLIPLLWNCSPKSEGIIITPKEIDDALVNPGRGFATTGLFNEDLGERLHPQGGVIQKRWYWDDIEPIEGKIRFSMIDSIIAKAVNNGQQLNFRIMCQDVEMRIPQWAIDKGIKPPFYDNHVFLEKHGNLIKAIAARYDGNPNIAFIDIGTVGQWGEWHEEFSDIKLPTEKNVIKIIDFYIDNFKKTPLVMLINGGQGLTYAISKGTGWRADCWGDMSNVFAQQHMTEFYPDALTSAKAYEAWKNGPVALETCWTMKHWYEQGWNLDYILNKALSWHASVVNNGSEEIPEEWWPKVQEFEKKLGYRFVIRQLEYPSIGYLGKKLPYSMILENVGVAPIYHHYPLAFYFQSTKDSTKRYVIETDEDITKWMPSKLSIESNIEIPTSIPPGEYNLSVGLINKQSKKPAIRLAIEGRTSDGWYQLGKIRFTN